MNSQKDAETLHGAESLKPADFYLDFYRHNPAGYFILNEKRIIKNVNISGTEIIKTPQQHLINKALDLFLSDESMSVFLEHLSTYAEYVPSASYELKLRQKDGGFIYTTNMHKKIRCQATGEIRILLLMQDITSQKLHAEQAEHSKLKIRNAELFALIENLSAAVLNELSQPLGVIINYANGCIRRISNNTCSMDDIIYAMNQIIQMAARSDKIHRRLKIFRYKKELSFQSHDINPVIDEILQEIIPEISASPVSIQFLPGQNLPQVMIDRDFIPQILSHIICNSSDMLSAGNAIHPEIIIETAFKQGHIEIIISDNGPRSTEEDRTVSSNSDFSSDTSDIRLGTTIAKTIIESHGGTFEVTTPVNGGNCFLLRLPVIDELI